MHSGRANDCNHLANAIERGRHPRGFSLKVPAKPVIKTGAGVLGFAADGQAPHCKDRLKSGHGHH
jgi:hypothetical protein